MKFIDDWDSKVCEADRFVNMGSKAGVIKLIRKFYRNNDGTVPRWSVLQKLSRWALCEIWTSKIPSNLFAQFSRL